MLAALGIDIPALVQYITVGSITFLFGVVTNGSGLGRGRGPGGPS